VWRRRNRTCLADANCTRDGRVWHLVHEDMRIGVRATVEQKARAGERIPERVSREARIAQIKQRIPAPWPATPRGRARIAVEVFPQCTDVANGRCHVSGVPHEPRRCLQDRRCLFSPRDGVVSGVQKTSEIEKFVRGRRLHRFTLPCSSATPLLPRAA